MGSATQSKPTPYHWSTLVVVAIVAAAGVFNLLPIVKLDSEPIKVTLTILGGLGGAAISFLQFEREKAK